MTIDDAIFNLETFGRHHLEKIQIDHDKSCEKLLRESVAVLESAGMIAWDKVQKCWYLIVIYKKEELENNKTNVGSIDLGLDNIATLTFKDGLNQYIFCGKKLKSVNSYTNKKIAHLQSIEMFKCGSDKFKNTKRINKIRRYRNNYINDYMHKVSKSIIDVNVNIFLYKKWKIIMYNN